MAYYLRARSAPFRAEWDAAIERHDRKAIERFLLIVQRTGDVHLACRRAGISHGFVYSLRVRDLSFRVRWFDAIEASQTRRKRIG